MLQGTAASAARNRVRRHCEPSTSRFRHPEETSSSPCCSVVVGDGGDFGSFAAGARVRRRRAHRGRGFRRGRGVVRDTPADGRGGRTKVGGGADAEDPGAMNVHPDDYSLNGWMGTTRCVPVQAHHRARARRLAAHNLTRGRDSSRPVPPGRAPVHQPRHHRAAAAVQLRLHDEPVKIRRRRLQETPPTRRAPALCQRDDAKGQPARGLDPVAVDGPGATHPAHRLPSSAPGLAPRCACDWRPARCATRARRHALASLLLPRPRAPRVRGVRAPSSRCSPPGEQLREHREHAEGLRRRLFVRTASRRAASRKSWRRFAQTREGWRIPGRCYAPGTTPRRGASRRTRGRTTARG